MQQTLPPATVGRLPRYLRFLETAECSTVSSEDIAAGSGVNAAQVRKDLSYLGNNGTRGVGYQTQTLIRLLRRVLGLSSLMKIAIVGTGNLGSALAGYSGFVNRGFQIVAAYDVSGGKIGRSIGGLEIRPIDRLESDIKEMGVDIVAIVTPAEASQEVADMAVRAGVRALLNFAPVSLHVEKGVTVRQVDLATEFQILSYHLANRI